jgi:hypothetical protein
MLVGFNCSQQDIFVKVTGQRPQSGRNRGEYLHDFWYNRQPPEICPFHAPNWFHSGWGWFFCLLVERQLLSCYLILEESINLYQFIVYIILPTATNTNYQEGINDRDYRNRCIWHYCGSCLFPIKEESGKQSKQNGYNLDDIFIGFTCVTHNCHN